MTYFKKSFLRNNIYLISPILSNFELINFKANNLLEISLSSPPPNSQRHLLALNPTDGNFRTSEGKGDHPIIINKVSEFFIKGTEKGVKSKRKQESLREMIKIISYDIFLVEMRSRIFSHIDFLMRG